MEFSTVILLFATALAGLTVGYLLAHWRWHTLFGRAITMARALASGARPAAAEEPWGAPLGHLARELGVIAEKLDTLEHRAVRDIFNLNAVLESMVEGVLVVDESARIQKVNAALLRQFGVKTSPLGQTVIEALRNADVDALIRETTAGGTPRNVDLAVATGGATTHTFQVNAVPVRHGDTVQGVVVVFHDITPIKDFERVRREFVSNVSHELRTPLSIFSGYLETLIDSPAQPPDELARILKTMQRHAQRLNALVEDLLSLSRFESGRMELALTSVNIPAFLNQMATDYTPRLGDLGAGISVETAPDLPPIQADPLRLEQVVSNLLENSITYRRDPCHIRLSAHPGPDGSITLAVRDNGIGIPSRDLPHIFGRFYRVDKGRSRASGGTGLGLSIAKHITELHGGRIEAESEFGQWTEIRLRLPVSPPETAAEAE